MQKPEKLISLIEQKKYSEAFEIYEDIPRLDLKSENPLLGFDFFEFSSTPKKNPVFLRALLNYISLINLLYDNIKNPLDFHKALFNFCAKFGYETKEIEKENYTQFVLMVKTNISIYNNIFQNDKKSFKNTGYKLGTINYKFKKNGLDKAGIGYTFQELGKSFIKDTILQGKVGVELPNLIFYLENNENVQALINKIFFLPFQCKINLNKRSLNYGYNEYDQVILLKEDFIINKDNPYMEYMECVEDNNHKTGDLLLTKNFVYFLEFKSSGNLIDDVIEDEKKNNLYIKLFNNNVIDNLQIQNLTPKFSLYIYNYSEKSGYDKIIKFMNDNIRFLYLNPSSHIVPLMNLKTQVYELKEELSEVKEELSEVKDELSKVKSETNELKTFQKDAISKFDYYDRILKDLKNEQKEKKSFSKESEIENPNRNSFNSINKEMSVPAQQNIFMNGENNDNNAQIELFEGFLHFPLNSKLKNKIENSFQKIASTVKEIKNIKNFKKLFNEYDQEMKDFLKKGESLGITNNKNINGIIGYLKDDDYKLCFTIFEPYIGKNKYPPHYNLIKHFFLAKSRKDNDEMKLIYKVLYLCFFGNGAEDKVILDKFFPSEKQEFVEGLKNIVKFTFYYDVLRQGKEYYMLTLFEQLINCNSESINKEIIVFKEKGLFAMILIIIILINNENSFYYNILNDFKKTNSFLEK